jgi:hypothetical protein
MKKRILRFTFGLIIATFMILPSCEFIESCGTCEQLYRDADGNITTLIQPFYYCGDAYLELLNKEPVEVAGTITYWNCY